MILDTLYDSLGMFMFGVGILMLFFLLMIFFMICDRFILLCTL